ncbi:hypothetical protein LTR10_002961 [Elasticomyces elasticus]|nr:hypothetical protein LTR10_002961 [Elasticomyces elasticus]KAK4967701.1 hypothetical protein LTR42_010026 [Elasticomyces elasticus]
MTRCSALETCSHFRYSPVEREGAIRLFTFLESADNEIMICLDEYAFGTQAYTAVSYEWGKEEASKSITIVPPSRLNTLVGMSFMPVRKNCWVALQQLRRRDTGEHYWLDFVCINQDDDDEKSAEVQRMASIYRQANMTALCLGEHDQASQIVFELLRWHERRAISEATNTAMEPHESLGYTRSKFDPAIWSFHDRSYFTRLWIVQEILLAKTVFVLCGNDRIHWQLFEAVTRRKTTFNTSTIAQISDSFLDQIFIMRDEFAELQEHGSTLDQLLAGCATRGCSDPRDKVYALLGLVAQDPTAEIKSDYSMSQTALTLTVIRHYLSTMKDREWHSAIRLLVRALESDDRDEAVVTMTKHCNNKIRRATAIVLQRLEEDAWDQSIHAHQRFLGHIERQFDVREIPKQPSGPGYARAPVRRRRANKAGAPPQPSESSTESTRRVISSKRSRLLKDEDVLLARAQIGRLYRTMMICWRRQGSRDEDGFFNPSDSLFDRCSECSCDPQSESRSEIASKKDAMVYVDAEDVFTYILRQEGEYRIEPAIVHSLTNNTASFRRRSRRMPVCIHF